jgi:hypothetical protein
MDGKNHQWVMMILIKIKDLIINNAIYDFLSKTGVLYFAVVFMPLTKSKNYEIWRVDRGLQIEFFSF